MRGIACAGLLLASACSKAPDAQERAKAAAVIKEVIAALDRPVIRYRQAAELGRPMDFSGTRICTVTRPFQMVIDVDGPDGFKTMHVNGNFTTSYVPAKNIYYREPNQAKVLHDALGSDPVASLYLEGDVRFKPIFDACVVRIEGGETVLRATDTDGTTFVMHVGADRLVRRVEFGGPKLQAVLDYSDYELELAVAEDYFDFVPPPDAKAGEVRPPGPRPRK